MSDGTCTHMHLFISCSSSNSSPILLLRIRLFPDYARVKRQRVLIRFSSYFMRMHTLLKNTIF